MKTAISAIFFGGLFFFTTCINKKLDFSEEVAQDSLYLFLDSANKDSLPFRLRLDYTKKAFEIIKNQENDSMHRVCLFRDDGIGFNDQDDPQVQVLRNIKSRVEEIGGGLKRNTALVQGISTKITIPLETNTNR